MPGYLQRLLDTAAPARPNAVSLTPVVRSTSPVFEHDQLLGLPEVQQQEALAPEPSPTTARHEPAPAWTPRETLPRDTSPEPALAPLAGQAPAALALRAPVAPHEIIDEAPPVSAPRGTPQPMKLPDSPSPPDSRPARRISPSVVRAAPRVVVAEPFEAPPLAPAEQPAPPLTPAVEALASRAPDAAMQPLPEGIVSPPRAQPVRSDPSGPVTLAEDLPRTDLSPRPRPEPEPDGPFHAEPPPAAAAPSQPTITIGQVTIEVVAEPGPAAAPRPLTAASASVIGPLGQARAARRLLALRRL